MKMVEGYTKSTYLLSMNITIQKQGRRSQDLKYQSQPRSITTSRHLHLDMLYTTEMSTSGWPVFSPTPSRSLGLVSFIPYVPVWLPQKSDLETRVP